MIHVGKGIIFFFVAFTNSLNSVKPHGNFVEEE
jgi:hypothetical protein